MAMTSAERSRRYKERHPEKRKEQSKAYHDRNREQRNADSRAWHADGGKEKRREQRGSVSVDEHLARLAQKRESHAAYMREWYKTEHGRRALVANQLRKQKIITIEEYDAAWDAQQGKCFMCGTFRERYTVSSGPRRLAVDHCHKSGKFRKLLCDNCNRLLGFARENQATLRAAIAYLDEHSV